MALVLTQGKQAYLNTATGDPLVGGKLYTYAAGTNTPQATWADAASVTPNANPVVLDARGEALIYWSGNYKLVLRDALDNVIWTVDNVASPEVAGASSTLRADLISVLDATKGAGAVSFLATLAYNNDDHDIGAALQDGMVNVMWFLSEAERAQVKANGTTLDLTAKINSAKAWAGNRPLYFPAGTWSFTSFSGLGWYGSIIGDGVGVTTLKVRSAVGNALDFSESADVIISPFVLRDFTLDGNNLASNGINVRYRHQSLMQNVYVIGCTSWGIIEKDAWNSRRFNVRTTGCVNGHWLVGSNHGSQFMSCVWSGATGIHLLVQSLGTALDGNTGLLFDCCQTVDGTGQGVDISADSASFDGCYLGENLGGVTMICRSGTISVNGGAMFFGSTVNSYLFAPVGGKVTVTGAKINGQTFGATALLNSTNIGGKWSLRDCLSAMSVVGDQVLLGDVLDYGPPGLVFSKRLGRNLTSAANNATRTELFSGNAITCTCATAPGPTPNITVTATLTGTPPEWRVGENLYLVVVYLSNAAFVARFSASAFGGAPTATIGTMPNTGSLVRTYVKLDGIIASAAYDRIEFYRDNCLPGEFIKIEEVFIADSRMLNKGVGSVGNLFKC
jgi:hypothetical protein